MIEGSESQHGSRWQTCWDSFLVLSTIADSPPLLGELFDSAFKANRCNMRLIESKRQNLSPDVPNRPL